MRRKRRKVHKKTKMNLLQKGRTTPVVKNKKMKHNKKTLLKINNSLIFSSRIIQVALKLACPLNSHLLLLQKTFMTTLVESISAIVARRSALNSTVIASSMVISAMHSVSAWTVGMYLPIFHNETKRFKKLCRGTLKHSIRSLK